MAISTRRYTLDLQSSGQAIGHSWDRATFRPYVLVTDGATVTAPAVPVVGRFNGAGLLVGSDGQQGVVLECNDDATTVPQGNGWQVTLDVDGVATSWTFIASVGDPNPCNLASKPHAQPSPGVFYLSPAQAAALEAAALTASNAAASVTASEAAANQAVASAVQAASALESQVSTTATAFSASSAAAQVTFAGEVFNADQSLNATLATVQAAANGAAGQVAQAQSAAAAAATSAGQAATSATSASASAAAASVVAGGNLPQDGTAAQYSLRSLGQGPRQAAPGGHVYLLDALAPTDKTGATDSTAAINVALAAVPSGSTVVASAGALYTLNGTIIPPVDNVTLDFAGATIRAGPARTGDNAAGDKLIALVGRGNVVVRNGRIAAPLSPPTISEFPAGNIMLTGCAGCEVSAWSTSTGATICDNASTDSRIVDNYLHHGGIFGISSVRPVVARNTIINTPAVDLNDAIGFTGYPAAPILAARYVDNTIVGSGRCGIEEYTANSDPSAAAGSSIVGNYFETCAAQAVSAIGSGVAIENNLFRNNPWAIESTAAGHRIVGNSIVNDMPQPSYTGINVNSSPTVPQTTTSAAVTLPAATIPLVNTAGFPTRGAVVLASGATVAYTGIAGGALTGCTTTNTNGMVVPAGTTVVGQRSDDGVVISANTVRNYGQGIQLIAQIAAIDPTVVSANTIVDCVNAISAVGPSVVAGNVVRQTIPLFDAAGNRLERVCIQNNGRSIIKANHITFDQTAAYPTEMFIERVVFCWGAGSVIEGNIVDTGHITATYGMNMTSLFAPPLTHSIVTGNQMVNGSQIDFSQAGCVGNQIHDNIGPTTDTTFGAPVDGGIPDSYLYGLPVDGGTP